MGMKKGNERGRKKGRKRMDKQEAIVRTRKGTRRDRKGGVLERE
jgi:hypothetical protein